VADDAFPASAFHSSLMPFAAPSELQRLQFDASGARTTMDVMGATLQQPAHVQQKANRAHLESCVAAALAMRSPAEWRRWLLVYVRFLCVEGDEVRARAPLPQAPLPAGRQGRGVAAFAGPFCRRPEARCRRAAVRFRAHAPPQPQGRLREVVEDLMGPLRWSPETHGGGGEGAAAAAAPDADAWQPAVLGIDKRGFLRHEVLAEVSRARSSQRLAAEIRGQLDAAEAHVAAAAGGGVAPMS